MPPQPDIQQSQDAPKLPKTDVQEQEQKTARARSMVPMSSEQYEAQQSVVREVYDPETGRIRLVRGTGEIIERIVSRDQHLSINKMATAGDGASFMRGVSGAAASSRR